MGYLYLMPKSKKKTEWKTVQIPEDLEKEVAERVRLGRFVSKNELVRNAIRWFLDALEKGEVS